MGSVAKMGLIMSSAHREHGWDSTRVRLLCAGGVIVMAMSGCADSTEPPTAGSSARDQIGQIAGDLVEGESAGVAESPVESNASVSGETWVPTMAEVCGLLDVSAFSDQVGTQVLASDPTDSGGDALDQEWTSDFPATKCTNYWDDGTGYFNQFGLGVGRPDDEWFSETTMVPMQSYECGVFDDLSKTLVCRTEGWELWLRTGLEFPASRRPMLSALRSFSEVERG